ncbi:NAD(P)H-dependent oxidoreductase [Brevibacillus brevis]|uniref:NAD(P)H-dependent oxidoreductase n=1 Tax=Brevibacillus brevis TaxID=1393 RepID=UPI001C8D62B0|nr:NAD(P)H-dependent oxidoreductase [Brevibacillus brevis]MBY0087469.1 NAD(P)H-dependent oxidoreductase [Brevibacillus brevis]UKK98714.1 NAD(P)H-dependent oxidoreductase [Brevibacillus brevis]
MKTLVIAVHPTMSQSRINRTWKERIQQEESVTVHDLYAAYPDFQIDVEQEQKLMQEHDRIVFQFPLYWYSTPALLKQWQDVVLTYGWAYGSEGNKLHGKELLLAISTGGPEEAYQRDGYNYYSISELIKPLQAMANLTGMKFLKPFLFQGVSGVSDEQIQHSAEEYVAHALNASLEPIGK